MPQRKVPTLYKKFQNYVSKCKTLVTCAWPGCDERMSLKSYQKHCKNFHKLVHLTHCAFCRGRKSWSRNEKLEMGKHLHACARRFVRGPFSGSTDESTMPTVTLQLSNDSAFPEDDDALFCSERCFAFRSWSNRMTFRSKWNDHDWIEAGAQRMEEPLFEWNAERLDEFEDVEEVERRMRKAKAGDKEKWLALLNPLRFDARSGLGQAHLWIKRFLYTHWTNKRTWYHLSVRAGCMESFVKAMEGIDIVAAPNWCVCDGGHGFDDPTTMARTHHRHLIVAVSNQKQFQKAMEKQIKYKGSDGDPEPGFKKYYGKQLHGANHFVNSLAYVSLPSSKCRCKQLLAENNEEDDEWNVPFWNIEDRPRRRHQGHCLLANNMHWHVRWWMQLLIPCDGIDRCAQFSIGSRSVYGMKSRCRIEERWTLSAADEFRVKNCVVRFDPPNLQIDGGQPIENLENYIYSPFENAFAPPPYPGRGNPFVYWFDGKKYPVRWTDERPPTFDDDAAFQEWHTTRGINTLLNLGECGSRFRMSRNLARHANDLDEQKQDCEKDMNAQIGAMQRTFDEKEQMMQRTINEINQELRDEKERSRKEKEMEKKMYEDCRKKLDKVQNDRIEALERDLKICRDEKRLREETDCSECDSLRLDKKKLQQKVKTLQQKIRRQR